MTILTYFNFLIKNVLFHVRDSVIFVFYFFAMCHVGILVPQLGIKALSPAMEAQSLNHWTTREVLR